MKKKTRLKPEVKFTLVIVGLVLIILGLNKLLANDMENHIKKVSYECAQQGYGIEAYYTKEGDKFYRCSVEK